MNSVSLGLLSRDVHDLTPIVNEGPGRLSYDGCPETIIPGRNCGFCHLPNYLEDARSPIGARPAAYAASAT